MVFSPPYFFDDIAENWRSTTKEQSVFNIIGEISKRFGHFLLIDVSHHSSPSLRDRFVHREIKIYLFVHLRIILQLIKQKNIFLSSVGKEQGQVWRNLQFVLSNVLNDLVERSDSSSTGDHEEVIVLSLPCLFATN